MIIAELMVSSSRDALAVIAGLSVSAVMASEVSAPE